MCSSISSAGSRSLTVSFQIWTAFLPFTSLITVARTSNTVLNKISESVNPCLILDLRESAFSFSP